MDRHEYANAARYTLIERDRDLLVVLLHGLGGDRDQPLGLTRDRLAATGASVLAPDARAHGETPLVGSSVAFTTAALAADVLMLVERLGLGDRQLLPVGISMGAAVGLELALQHPGRVAGAVLVRPSFGRHPWPPHLQVFRTIASMLRGGHSVAEFQRTEEYRSVLGASPAAAESLVAQFGKPRAVERVVRLDAVPANTAVDWVGKRDPGLPVTIVGAHGDPGHPLDIARLWSQQLTGSVLHEVPSRDREPGVYAEQLDHIVTDAVAAIRFERTAR